MILVHYRMFDEKDDLPHTLFHGVNGSRKLPLDTWVEAAVKTVCDGSKHKSTAYQSGFHVFEHFNDVVSFLSRFRKLDGRVICAVEIDANAGIWDKEHSPSKVKLARRMRIPAGFWEMRISAEEEVKQDG